MANSRCNIFVNIKRNIQIWDIEEFGLLPAYKASVTAQHTALKKSNEGSQLPALNG